MPSASKIILVWVFLFIVKKGTGKSDLRCSNAQPDCVCNIPEVIRRMRDYMEYFEGQSLEKKIKDFECRSLNRLTASLKIDVTGSSLIFGSEVSNFPQASGDGKPPEYFEYFKTRRKRRHVNLGTPSNEVFNEAIAQLDPESLHQYVILGSSVTFHCGEEGERDELESVHRGLTWTHYNGDPITAPQVKIDKTRGSLTFPAVQLSDIGIYNCSQEVSDDENGNYPVVTSHQLSVISEPIFWLKHSSHYETEECNQEEARLIRKHIPDWIKAQLCPLCEVHNVSVTCSRGSSAGSPIYKVGTVVSTIGLNIKLEKAANVESCRISCLEMVHARILELVRDGMIKAFQIPIEVEGSGGQKLVHKAMKETFQIELLEGCLSGFHLQYKLCFPCRPGQFSKEGETGCHPCPIGQFQPHLASTSCIPCPEGSTTTEIGSTSDSQCYGENLVHTAVAISGIYTNYKILLGISCGFLLLVLMIVLSVCLCCPKSGTGKVIRKYCCCCCVKSPGSDYEKLGDEGDDVESREKDKRRDKERQKEKAKRPKDKSDKIKRSGRSERRASSRRTREASELRGKNDPGQVVKARRSAEMRDAMAEEKESRQSLIKTGDEKESMKRGEVPGMATKDEDENILKGDGTEKGGRANLEPSNPSARLRGTTFNSFVDELKFRGSLEKPIGASSDSSNSPGHPDREINSNDLQTKFKPTPLRSHIALHNDSPRDQRSSMDSGSETTPSSIGSSPEESEKEKEKGKVLSFDRSRIPVPPPMPPPLWRPS